MGRGNRSKPFLVEREDLRLASAEERFYRGLKKLEMEKTPDQISDLGLELGDIQAVIDHLTRWDDIDPTWYSEEMNPDNWDGVTPNFTAAEKKWAGDTQKRWKIGILHHQDEGLVWTAWNKPHQEAGQWHSGRTDHVVIGKHLGDVLGEVYSWTAMIASVGKDKQKKKVPLPPGLKRWWTKRKAASGALLNELAELEKRI